MLSRVLQPKGVWGGGFTGASPFSPFLPFSQRFWHMPTNGLTVSPERRIPGNGTVQDYWNGARHKPYFTHWNVSIFVMIVVMTIVARVQSIRFNWRLLQAVLLIIFINMFFAIGIISNACLNAHFNKRKTSKYCFYLPARASLVPHIDWFRRQPTAHVPCIA